MGTPLRIKIIFLATVIVLTVLSIFSYIKITRLIDKSASLIHTNEVKLSLKNISSAVVNMEYYQKSFLLTSDSSLLLKRDSAFNRIASELNMTDSLIKDNPKQVENIRILRSLIDENKSNMKNVLQSFIMAQSSPELKSAINSEIHLTEKVRGQLNKMQNEEDKLLIERSESFTNETVITPLSALFLILGSLVIVIASYLRIMQDLKIAVRLKSEKEKSEIETKTILETAPYAVITTDENGIIIGWNPKAELLFGWKEKEVSGKALTETIIPERLRRQYEGGISHFLKTGKEPAINKAIELQGLRKDKTEIPVELNISEVKINNTYTFIGFIQDISVRKKAEESIAKKSRQLMEAQKLAHIGSWEWDVKNNKIEWSDELYRIYGIIPQAVEAGSESILDIVDPDDREYVNRIVQQAVKDQQPFNFFYKIIRHDGEVRVLNAAGKVSVDENGNTTTMSGTAQDVTEQKKHEAFLLNRQERFFKIFENNPIAMTFGEIGSNKILYANTLFYNSFGYTAEEVINHSSEELNLISDEENQRLIPIILGQLEETRSVEELRDLPIEETAKLLTILKEKIMENGFEVQYTRKDGSTFDANVFYQLINIEGNIYAVTSYQDITEKKKTAKLIEEQNNDLIKINKELESFNYVSSHDLQEPLRKIQTFASRIQESEHQNLSDRGKDYFNRIQKSAAYMQNLVKDLLAFSRINFVDKKFECTDLRTLVKEVENEFRESIDEKHAIIEIGEMCSAAIIPFQFHQLMTNLIGNSLKFTAPGITPRIQIKSVLVKGSKVKEVTLLPAVTYCHITVSDNGIGFEPEYDKSIFEVFQRLHTKEKYSGTGIGLAIVKKIVDNHYGIITATSQLNKGATFNIYIPTDRK